MNQIKDINPSKLHLTLSVSAIVAIMFGGIYVGTTMTSYDYRVANVESWKDKHEEVSDKILDNMSEISLDMREVKSYLKIKSSGLKDGKDMFVSQIPKNVQ